MIVTRAGNRRDGKTSAGEEEAFSQQTTERSSSYHCPCERRCYLDFVTMLATAYTSRTLVVKTSLPLRARGCAIVRL